MRSGSLGGDADRHRPFTWRHGRTTRLRIHQGTEGKLAPQGTRVGERGARLELIPHGKASVEDDGDSASPGLKSNALVALPGLRISPARRRARRLVGRSPGHQMEARPVTRNGITVDGDPSFSEANKFFPLSTDGEATRTSCLPRVRNQSHSRNHQQISMQSVARLDPSPLTRAFRIARTR
jgi:hypothetical protein